MFVEVELVKAEMGWEVVIMMEWRWEWEQRRMDCVNVYLYGSPCGSRSTDVGYV
jgi:hypothetical protein